MDLFNYLSAGTTVVDAHCKSVKLGEMLLCLGVQVALVGVCTVCLVSARGRFVGVTCGGGDLPRTLFAYLEVPDFCPKHVTGCFVNRVRNNVRGTHR